jgi:hypothetical protein
MIHNSSNLRFLANFKSERQLKRLKDIEKMGPSEKGYVLFALDDSKNKD